MNRHNLKQIDTSLTFSHLICFNVLAATTAKLIGIVIILLYILVCNPKNVCLCIMPIYTNFALCVNWWNVNDGCEKLRLDIYKLLQKYLLLRLTLLLDKLWPSKPSYKFTCIIEFNHCGKFTWKENNHSI